MGSGPKDLALAHEGLRVDDAEERALAGGDEAEQTGEVVPLRGRERQQVRPIAGWPSSGRGCAVGGREALWAVECHRARVTHGKGRVTRAE